MTTRRTSAIAFVGQAVALLVLLPAGEARSEPEAPAPAASLVGARVRLRVPSSSAGRLVGTVLQMDGDSLVIRPVGAAPLSVSRRSITELEVHTGRRRKTWLGMGIGAGAGALAFGINPCVNEGCTSGFSGEMALIGGIGGAVSGAVVGTLIHTDRWTAIPLDQVRLTLAPTRGHGARLALSIRF